MSKRIRMRKLSTFFIFMVFMSNVSITPGQNVLTLQPGPQEGIDTYICSIYPYEAGYDKGLGLLAWTLDGNPFVGMQLLKFDLSALSPSVQIIDARLSLFYDPNGSWPEHTGDNTFFIKRVTSAWTENTACWANQPSVTENGRIDFPATTDPYQDFPDIDVKDFVSDWVADPSINFGVKLGLYTSIPYACMVLSSSDGAIPELRPKLVVTYIDCDPPVAAFTYSHQSTAFNFYDASSSAQSWVWDFGDGYASYLQNPVHEYATEGIYHVCLTVQDSCGSDTFCDSVHACAAASAQFSYLSQGHWVTFADSSENAVTWYWDFNDGFMSDLQNPVHYFEDFGTYYVCLTAANACGQETYCDSVVVATNGIEDRPGLTYTVYPNPSNSVITIERSVVYPGNACLTVTDLQGKIIFTREIFPDLSVESEPISISSLSPGVYILKILSGSSLKIVKFVRSN
jgi:PKD repeat protein